MLTFMRITPVFPEQKLWGATLSGRWSFCIVHQPKIGYTATWKDQNRSEAHQANLIGGDYATLGQAKRACDARARQLLS